MSIGHTPLRSVIYDVPTLVPVAGEIMAEPHEEAGLDVSTVRQRYASLTAPLPLAGFDALPRTADGEIHMIASLRQEAPWMEYAIAAIEVQLERQLLLGRPWVHFAPMLLVGPPGCGKSWLAKRIAELAGVGSRTIDLAGAMDATLVIGNPRGWMAPMPSFPVLAITETQLTNPLCIAEEVDKAGGSERYGDPIAALLALLEPSTARRYRDRCLQAEVDVRAVNWIMTANAITPRLPAPFLSRVEIIEVAMPPPAMVDEMIALLVTDVERRWQLPPHIFLDLPRQIRATLRDDYRRNRSVRRLKRAIEALAGFCLPERCVH